MSQSGQTDFADLLKAFREEAGLSFKELAPRVQVTETYLRQLENPKEDKKNPSADLVARLADVFRLPHDRRCPFYRAAGIEETELESEDLATKRRDLVKLFWDMPANERTIASFWQMLKTRNEPVRDQQVAKRMLERCEQLGFVQHHVWVGTNMDDLPFRDADLEQQLLQRFKLKHAIVASVPEMVWTETYTKWTGLTDEQIDNRVHAWLGRMAAPLFLALLRKGDRVAVGSGRGPYECICAAERRVPKRYAELKEVMSLTGSMGVERWDADRGDPCLDADAIAHRLTASLFFSDDRFEASVVKAKLFAKKEKYGGVLPKHLQNWDPALKDNCRLPNVAVVGIGALAGGHRLLSEDVCREQAVATQLNRLKEIAGEIDKVFVSTGDEYHCVADLANYLVTVQAPRQEQITPELWTKLEKCVKAINDYVIAPEPSALATVAEHGAVIAVAGGRFKKHAIRRVLLEPKQERVSHLVCDDETARWLVENSENR